MRKYELFQEWGGQEIYGENLADALLHATLRKADIVIDGRVLRGEEVEVASILGEEDVSSSTRGVHRFYRIVVETSRGERVAIDGMKRGTLSRVE